MDRKLVNFLVKGFSETRNTLEKQENLDDNFSDIKKRMEEKKKESSAHKRIESVRQITRKR